MDDRAEGSRADGAHTAAESSRTADALSWARRQLSVDGVRRLLAVIARFLRGIRVLGLFVFGWGLVGALLALLLLRDQTGLLVVALLLCAPALVGPLLAGTRLRHLARSLEQPDEVAAQARDLGARLRDSAELRQLADRVRSGSAASGRSGGRSRTEPSGEPSRTRRSRRSGGRIRRAFGTARLASAVLGQTGPDPRRHALLVPFTPTRLRGLWFLLGVTAVGIVLVFVSMLFSVLGALTANL